jgi:hypothetical protein
MRIRSLFSLNLNPILGKPVLCTWEKLTDLTVKKVIRGIKLRYLSWPAYSVQDSANFGGVHDEGSNFDLFAASADQRV